MHYVTLHHCCVHYSLGIDAYCQSINNCYHQSRILHFGFKILSRINQSISHLPNEKEKGLVFKICLMIKTINYILLQHPLKTYVAFQKDRAHYFACLLHYSSKINHILIPFAFSGDFHRFTQLFRFENLLGWRKLSLPQPEYKDISGKNYKTGKGSNYIW